MPTQKAGCILLNRATGTVCLIFREKHLDCSFPKGHVEENETLFEAAIRETDEEAGRRAVLIAGEEPVTLSYVSIKGESINAHYFLAYDDGPSDTVYDDSLKHKPFWVTPDKVAETVTHENLRTLWETVRVRVDILLKL